MAGQRYHATDYPVWVGIVGNGALALMKGTVGWFAGSKALMADAAHTAADVVGSLAAKIGVRASKRTPDDNRPYAQSVAAIVVSVLLLIVGFEMGVSALKKIYYGVGKPPEAYALYAIAVSVVVKEAIFRYKYRLGKGGAFYPRSHRSDVLSSAAAFIGIAGALLGQVLDVPQFFYLDPLAGLFVSLLMMTSGYKLVTEAIRSTIDQALCREDTEELVLAVQRVKGVLAVDDLRATELGHYVFVDVKISVNPRISVMEGNEIAKAVKFHLMKRFIHVADVSIQVSPYDPGYPYKHNVDASADEVPTLLH